MSTFFRNPSYVLKNRVMALIHLHPKISTPVTSILIFICVSLYRTGKITSGAFFSKQKGERSVVKPDLKKESVRAIKPDLICLICNSSWIFMSSIH